MPYRQLEELIMTAITRTLQSRDGYELNSYFWPSTEQAPAKGYLHLLHGMAEHAERYQALAEFFAARGFNVIAHDHRGHGNCHVLGHYADEQGGDKVVEDILFVQQQLIEDKSQPIYLLGHSMGSFIAQAFAIKYGDHLAGLILSGSNYQNPLLYKVAKLVTKFETLRIGAQTPSKVMDFLSFGAFNGKFKPTKTEFDWLSRDSEQVDKYIADNLCGFPCSPTLWADLFDILITISDKNQLKKIPQHLPIYLFSGDQDPVGQMGKGVPALHDKLKQTGHDNVTITMYPQGRHEMLNETNRQQVFADLEYWLAALT